MKAVWRTLIVIFGLYVTLMSLAGLQTLFDRGDFKRASKAIYEFKPLHSPKTLAELMAQKWQKEAEELNCESSIISRFSGEIRVECWPSESKISSLVWRVDVLSGQIVPDSLATHDFFKEIQHKTGESL